MSQTRQSLIQSRDETHTLGAAPAETTKRPAQAAFTVDPVVELVQEWMARQDAADALTHEWQRLEHQLSLRIKPLGIGMTEASRRGFAEVRRMRRLDKRIAESERRLRRVTERILPLRARSIEGVAAKIEMGLRIQEPLDCEEFSWALLKSGFEELREILGLSQPQSPSPD